MRMTQSVIHLKLPTQFRLRMTQSAIHLKLHTQKRRASVRMRGDIFSCGHPPE